MVNNSESEKDNRQFQLYKQLHEQFAVNDNNKTNNVISFLAAIFSVFVGYGVVFYHYSNKEDSLVMATIASLLILMLVCVLCLFFGYSTRRDQFITHEIRKKYDVELHYTNPCDRKHNKWSFLPDYYSIMLYACIGFMFLLTIVTVLQLLKAEESFCVVIAAFGLLLLTVYFFMGFYFNKHEEFKNRFTKTSNSDDMNKTNILTRVKDSICDIISTVIDFFAKAWDVIRIIILFVITVVVVVFLVVILSNIFLFSCNHLTTYFYQDGNSGIVNLCNLDDYLNVLGTFFLALMATFAFWESLKMRRRSSFNAIFTQLLSNHVAIFKDVAESNPISSSTKIKTNVFAGFYEDYKVSRTLPMNGEKLQELWKHYCDNIPDSIKFSHAFKYVFHEAKTVYDEYRTTDPMRKQYIKIIQANMSQDELFCYLINLLQHYFKSEEKEEIKQYFENLKESNFFEDLIRKDGKYCPVICELRNTPDSKTDLQLLFDEKQLENLPNM